MKSATGTVIILFVLIECYANFTDPSSAPSHSSRTVVYVTRRSSTYNFELNYGFIIDSSVYCEIHPRYIISIMSLLVK